MCAHVACGGSGDGDEDDGGPDGPTVPLNPVDCADVSGDERQLSWAYPAPVGADLEDVWVSPTGTVWIAGQLGTLLRFDGDRFEAMPYPENRSFYSLWGSADDDIWVTTQADLMHYDGERWSKKADPSGLDRGQVHGSGPNDVWWVTEGQAMHFTDSGMDSFSLGDSGSAIWVHAPDAAWAYASGSIHRWDGTAWTTEQSISNVIAIDGSGPTDIWAITQERAYHFDGVTWTQATDIVTEGSEELRDVWSAGPNDTWFAVTRGSLGALWHRIGLDQVSKHDTPEDVLPPRALGGRGTLWGVGPNGSVGHVEGETWVSDSHGSLFGEGESVTGVGSDGWLINGDDIGIFDGETFTALPMADPELNIHVRALWVNSPVDAWAVGSDVLHWDGAAWTVMEITLNDLPLYDVWASGPNDVWAVGEQGTVLHYDGQSWSLEPLPGAYDLRWVAGIAGGPVLVGGDDAPVAAFSGGSWETISNGDIDRDLDGEAMVDAVSIGDAVWMAGNGRVKVFKHGRLSDAAICESEYYRFSHIGAGADGQLWLSEDETLLRFTEDGVEPLAIAPMDLTGMWSNDQGRLIVTVREGLMTLNP